ncbi:MAG: tRNA pseudouridine(55) synthase TruB [Bdellovibrionales bacterium]|nr:tRNA pseudouridine(55) synthase TruB [Bdellovibrionales bacterium]
MSEVRAKPKKNTTFDPAFPQSGALLIDKPEGITSNDVAFKIRKALSMGERLPWGFKIGHGGTLDPFATGMLVIFYGEATKLANVYLRSQKSYSGHIQLGARTDSADYTGKIVEEAVVPPLSLNDWQALADEFVRESYLQTPPMYSAKKIDGRPLYHLAREGRDVEREAVLKKIYEFKLSALSPTGLNFNVRCESGTYVRTLAEDLATKAGTLAHLKSLRRTASSDLTVAQAASMTDAIEQLTTGAPASGLKFVMRIPELAQHLPVSAINAEEEEKLRRGVHATIRDLLERFNSAHPDALYGLLRADDRFPVGLIHEKQLQRVMNR